MNTVRSLCQDFVRGVVIDDRNFELVGWLVIIDFALYLIPEDYADNYKDDCKIEVSESEIIFAITKKIMPLGGGGSFIFHKSKVVGALVAGEQLKIKITSLSAQERSGDFCSINLSENDMREHKNNYTEFLRGRKPIKSRDWLDWL